MQFVKVLVPPPVAMPRGAQWASEMADSLAQVGHQMWRELESFGQARAQRELQRLSDRSAHNPELARSLRDAMHRGNRG